MEHRWCKRRKLIIEVGLSSSCGTACAARTRDISMDGMFVELQSTDPELPRLLDVQLPAALGIPGLEALVVRTCEQGVGLMFGEVDNRKRQLLARYLSESDGKS